MVTRRRRSTLVPALGTILLTLTSLALPAAASAETLRVPTHYATVQSAIEAARNGDVVLVAPGVYRERIDFLGKDIVVRSQAGPHVTVLDGEWSGTVVTFQAGEGPGAVLEGFTIRHGDAHHHAGGIQTLAFSSPVIRGNRIEDNRSCTNGGGVGFRSGAPVLEGNLIRNNEHWCHGLGGGGVAVFGASVTLVGNVIEDNRTTPNPFNRGGGVMMFNGAHSLVANNVIRNNSCGGKGGGLSFLNSTDALVMQNLIVGNEAREGGGVYWLGTSAHPRLVNNTVADNTAMFGSAVFADGIGDASVLESNLLIAHGEEPVMGCGSRKLVMPSMRHNDLHTDGPNLFVGPCSSPMGTDGNISADPRFSPSGDYRLTRRSPAVDAGSQAPLAHLPEDLAGRTRIIDGDRDGAPVIDLGAFELSGPSGR